MSSCVICLVMARETVERPLQRMSHISKHVSKAGKVEPGDRVTLPVKIACKPDPLARVTLAQGNPLSL